MVSIASVCFGAVYWLLWVGFVVCLVVIVCFSLAFVALRLAAWAVYVDCLRLPGYLFGFWRFAVDCVRWHCMYYYLLFRLCTCIALLLLWVVCGFVFGLFVGLFGFV